MNIKTACSLVTRRFLLVASVFCISLPPSANAVTVESFFGESLPLANGSGSDSITSSVTFDISGGSTLVVAVSAEGRINSPAISEVLFGTQLLTQAGRFANQIPASPDSNFEKQIVEIWYLDNPFNTDNLITVNWDTTESDTPVNGIGWGAVSLNNVVQGGPTSVLGADGQSVSPTVDNNNSFVLAGNVANGGPAVQAETPLTEVYSSNNIGSATAGVGYELNVAAGTPTYSFTGGGSRPVTLAAVFEDGPFIPPTLQPVRGDIDGDRDVDVTETFVAPGDMPDIDGVSDFQLLANQLGATGQVPGQGADIANSDGAVDFRDLRALRQFLVDFNNPEELAAISVPEPTSSALVLSLFGVLTWTRSGRKHS